ncbi:MAG: hypothetical protein ACRYF3_15830, partial [Janthinobacterium lividum]
GKEAILEAFLQRRDQRWRSQLADFVEQRPDPYDRVMAVFDWLERWFTEPGFRGCGWINAFGELGGTSTTVQREVVKHKTLFKQQLTDWVAAAGANEAVAEQLFLLTEGAMVTAGITGDPSSARTAKAAAQHLMRPR